MPVDLNLYDIDAYRMLFEYTKRKLVAAVGDPDTDLPYPSLVRHMYADQLAIDALFKQTTQKLELVYWYDPKKNRTVLNADITNSTMFAVSGDKSISGGYVSNSWGSTMHHTHPDILLKMEVEVQHVLSTALERLGPGTTFDLLIELVYNIYNGVEILHFCFDLDDTHYQFCVEEQTIMEQRDPGPGRNVWLWYAHAISAGMWALDIKAPELDRLINDVLNNRLPAGLTSFAQYLQPS